MDYQLIIDYHIGAWGYSKQFVRSILDRHKGKHVDVKITSPGGDLDHGLDIRQQFVDHGDVTVYLSGFVASAATVIAMGAKRIVMSKYAMLLVHKCSNFIDAWGNYNADQMAELIADLEANKKENDKIDVVLANMYASRCKKKVSEILDILKEGRWMTAQEALDLGFVDEIADPADDEQPLKVTEALKTKFNAFGLSTLGLEPEAPKKKQQNVVQKVIDKLTGKNRDANFQIDNMNKKKFCAVDELLGMESPITADADGDVTLKSDDVAKIDAHISSQKAKIDQLEKAKTENEAKISELQKQIDDLLEGPGDDTKTIEDNGGDEPAYTASSIYESIKGII